MKTSKISGMTWNIGLIILALFLMTLGQFEKIGQTIYLHDFVLGLFIITNAKKLQPAFFDTTKKYGWYFIGFALLSFFLNIGGKNPDSILVAISYWLRWTTYYLTFCLLSVDNNKKSSCWLSRGLLIYCGTVLAIGLAQWLFYPNMKILSFLGWDDHYYRLIGSWLDPNFTGLILVLGFLGALGRLGGLRIMEKLGMGGILLIGILLTYSRSSYLALLVGLLFLFRWRIGLAISLVTGLIILGYVFLIPKPPGEGGNLFRKVSIEARLRSYNRGIEIFKSSPIYGIGFNNYKYIQEKAKYIPSSTLVGINSASGNDNSFILILATTGLIGLGLFILFWVKLFIAGGQLVKASIAAITVHSFFNNSLFFPAVIIWLWLVISVSIDNGRKSSI